MKIQVLVNNSQNLKSQTLKLFGFFELADSYLCLFVRFSPLREDAEKKFKKKKKKKKFLIETFIEESIRKVVDEEEIRRI